MDRKEADKSKNRLSALTLLHARCFPALTTTSISVIMRRISSDLNPTLTWQVCVTGDSIIQLSSMFREEGTQGGTDLRDKRGKLPSYSSPSAF